MKNTLIKASAGTGKTFALATRAIRLLLLGVEPQEIVALTFTRAAAGEIFDRIVSRLANAAASDEGAVREAGYLQVESWKLKVESSRTVGETSNFQLSTFNFQLPPLIGKDIFAGLLRKVIFTQHLTRIGTVDSFMVQMVRSFPLELGLQGNITLMEDYLAAREKRKAVDGILDFRFEILDCKTPTDRTDSKNLKSQIQNLKSQISAPSAPSVVKFFACFKKMNTPQGLPTRHPPRTCLASRSRV